MSSEKSPRPAANARGHADRPSGLLQGRVQGNRKGFGFFIPDEGGEDLYLARREMRGLLSGDRVLVEARTNPRQNRREARIKKVLERKTKTLVGRIYLGGAFARIEPLNQSITQHFLVPQKETAGAENGQLVTAEITVQPSASEPPRAKVLQVLGETLAPDLAVQAAITSHQLPHEFSQAVQEEADAFARELDENAGAGRFDLTHLPFVTIDGEDARDFDDAVFAERQGKNGFRLLVAIADVAAYVKPGSALDEEAWTRGNSVYFPRFVLPMLPEVLSNGLCSLNPQVKRLSLVAELSISAEGKTQSGCFYEALICSRQRLTYTQVSDWMQDDFAGAGKIAPQLQALQQLFAALRSARRKRGALDLDMPEIRLEFDAEGEVSHIHPVPRNDAQLLIEECMLAANVQAARFLRTHKIPCLYRVHERSDAGRVQKLREFLAYQGLDLPGGELPGAADYQTVVEKVCSQPNGQVIQTMLLRSMSQAVYQLENQGHYGLNYFEYTHFTSPIRRYPDLLVHRAIKSVIHSRRQSNDVRRVADAAKRKAPDYPYEPNQIESTGGHCSMTERRASEAGYQVSAWLKCRYMEKHLGEDHAGVITSAAGFGLFVLMGDLCIEGLIPIRSLGQDYYRFEPGIQALVGESTGKVYCTGDLVQVRVARVDVDECQIDLQLLDHRPAAPAPGMRRKNPGKGQNTKAGSQGRKKSARQKRSAAGKSRS